jgi:peptidoglycan/xylan/chitin deacetylase (PgdA/CDA1 family)
MLIIIGRNSGRLILILIVLLIIVDTSQIALLTAAKAVVSTVSGRLVPVYSVLTSEPRVSLTFEAASGKDMTRGILGALGEHNVTATFFLSGEWMEKHEDSARAISENSHELGNYTYFAPHPNSLLKADLKRELEKAHKYIEKVTGQAPKVFRPPYGEYSNKVIEVARELGYETVIWSIESLDWRGTSSEDMLKRILGKLHKGAIIRFHVTGRNTPEALPQIIEAIRSQGYEIVPLSQLLLEGDYYIHPHTGEMRPIHVPSAGRVERRSLVDET